MGFFTIPELSLIVTPNYNKSSIYLHLLIHAKTNRILISLFPSSSFSFSIGWIFCGLTDPWSRSKESSWLMGEVCQCIAQTDEINPHPFGYFSCYIKSIIQISMSEFTP